jgi:pyruvate dehydrogenase E2 component (dihydrolipoamide acetyltransferase)
LATASPSQNGSAAAAPARSALPAPPAQVDTAPPGARVSATPLARRIAASRRIDLANVVGSGPFGRIVKRDVLATPERNELESSNGTVPGHPPTESADTVAAAPAGAAALTTSLGAPAGGRGAVTTTEPTRIQAAIARRMLEAKSEMPEFTLEVEVDMDAAVKLREELKALRDEVVPSFNDFVVRACALALRAHPWANGAFRNGRFEHYERVNIGVAVAVPGSLLVPTVYDADRRSLGDIARATRRLAEAARAGTLTPTELDGGTFSVSNLGMFGVRRFAAVLNPPQAAILAVGGVEQRPVVRGGEIVPGYLMPVTLTCDHRILYGADAATFLAAIRANLEAPLRLAM